MAAAKYAGKMGQAWTVETDDESGGWSAVAGILSQQLSAITYILLGLGRHFSIYQ